jgi:RNA polymerase sigma-70 factor (ECF subfamily)
MKITDEQIIKLIKNDKTLNAGFKMLMDAYQQRLYHHIRSILGNHEDTDDVLQNTFIKVFRNINNFEGRSKLFTWLYRIATNEATTFLKKNMRKNSFMESSEMGDFTNSLKSEEGSDGEFVKEMLKKALEELPPKQKAIFSLRYFEEMNYNDMSEITGTSVGALKASYHHAVKKIENYIKQVVIYQ